MAVPISAVLELVFGLMGLFFPRKRRKLMTLADQLDDLEINFVIAREGVDRVIEAAKSKTDLSLPAQQTAALSAFIVGVQDTFDLFQELFKKEARKAEKRARR